MDTVKRENCLEDSRLAKQANVVTYSLSKPDVQLCLLAVQRIHILEEED